MTNTDTHLIRHGRPCPECGSTNTEKAAGEIACNACGTETHVVDLIDEDYL